MKMLVQTDNSAQSFLDSAGPLLYGDESANSLMLGLCGNLLKMSEPRKINPVLLRVVEDGITKSAAIQTPPHNLVITYASGEHLELLARHLHEHGVQFPGVVGPAEESEQFANIWSALTNRVCRLGMGQKIYKIEQVKVPSGVRGRLRLAGESEVELVARWLHEFTVESIPHERKTVDQLMEIAATKIKQKYSYFWEVDGNPVSTAQIGRPTQNGISVSAVYTPRNLRRQGYASAVVAYLSQKMVESEYKFCVLYTDLANPTSNKIYQEVGYREVSSSKHFLFEDFKL